MNHSTIGGLTFHPKTIISRFPFILTLKIVFLFFSFHQGLKHEETYMGGNLYKCYIFNWKNQEIQISKRKEGRKKNTIYNSSS